MTSCEDISIAAGVAIKGLAGSGRNMLLDSGLSSGISDSRNESFSARISHLQPSATLAVGEVPFMAVATAPSE